MGSPPRMSFWTLAGPFGFSEEERKQRKQPGWADFPLASWLDLSCNKKLTEVWEGISMKTCLAAVLALALSGTIAEARQSQPTPASTELLVEGVSCGLVRSWEGGEVRARVALDAPGADRISKKRVTGMQCTPIVIELDLPPAKPAVDWMNEMLSGKPVQKKIVLNWRNSQGFLF